jgi:hypothetical protein
LAYGAKMALTSSNTSGIGFAAFIWPNSMLVNKYQSEQIPKEGPWLSEILSRHNDQNKDYYSRRWFLQTIVFPVLFIMFLLLCWHAFLSSTQSLWKCSSTSLTFSFAL